MPRLFKRFSTGSKFQSEVAGRSPYKLQLPTRFFICLLLAASLYFIAGSVGSGWIFLMSAASFAALAAGLLLPFLNLAGLDARQNFPSRATAGEPLRVTVTLSKSKNSFFCAPAHWLLVSYAPGKAAAAAAAADDSGSKAQLVELLLQEESLDFKTSPLRRGVFPAGSTVIESSFPVGLAWLTKKIAWSGSITVYPRVCPIEGSFLYRLRPSGYAMSGLPRAGSAQQSTYTRSLRAYARGDSPRTIHWVSSARLGKLMVREFDAEGLPSFDVFIDVTAAWLSSQQFELALTTVASLLSAGQRNGIHPDLYVWPQTELVNLDLPASLPGPEMNMEILARLERQSRSGPPPRLARRQDKQATLIVVCPQGKKEGASPYTYYIEIADSGKKPQRLPDPLEASLAKRQEAEGQAGAPSLYQRERSINSSLVRNEDDITYL